MLQPRDKATMTRDFVGYGPNPPDPKWPGGARLALNIVLNYEEGSEASFEDGDSYTETGLTEGGSGGFDGRDLGAESMFEYGSRVGVWRILRLLKERDLTATLFACAVALERNPAVAEAVVQNGFDICCHGRRWVRHQALTENEEALEIQRAVASIVKATGVRPMGWYCRYAPTVSTRRLLVDHGGFLYDSDAYNDELPYWVPVGTAQHLVIPYSLTTNDAKFSRSGMNTAQQFFEFLRDSFDLLYAEGATAPRMMSVGLHMRLCGHPGRAAGLARFLDHVKLHPGVWVCRRADIATHWHKTHPPELRP
jgi:allantoinase